MSTLRPNPNDIDYSRQNNRTALGICPLRKPKVQLLPLRYGLVERLDPAAALSLPYQTTSRPMGIRLVRDGWLYVIDNTSGYLHEYRVENGEVSQFVWQGNEASQDHRQGKDTQQALLFSRATTLHFAYSEVQWTANKCSKMIDSRPDRDHFMQCVDLSSADCVKGGPHLLTDAQTKQWLAEVAEPPSSVAPAEGVHPQETQDYVWEDTPLFKKTPIAVVKRQMLAAYEYDHLYLVFNDTLGVMRDLAEEQDTVVGWIDEWVAKEKLELKYLVGSYIETLMVLNDQSAPNAGVSPKLFEKTTPQQREAIYAYLNARNTFKGLPSSASPEKAAYPGQGYDANSRAVRQTMDDKKKAMHDALGQPLHDELEDDIEALQDHGDAALQGKGLGARGIHDLVRHQEMTAYLEAQRVHIKRWTARLDRITVDRTHLLTRGDMHRSLWAYDPDNEEQLLAVLAAEYNCLRDLCRTDESLEAVSEYLHAHPYYLLPAFGSRLDWAFLNSKAPDLIKLLDDSLQAQDNIVIAQGRLVRVSELLGRYWGNSVTLNQPASNNSLLVQALYAPAAALRTEQWLVKLQTELNNPTLKAHLDDLHTVSNRAHRLAGLIALEHSGATLYVASAQQVEQFSIRIANLNVLLKNEETYKYNFKLSQRDSNRRYLSDLQRERARLNVERYYSLWNEARSQRWQLVQQIESSLTVTSSQAAGFIGVKLDLDPQQKAYLDEEIKRLRSGVRGGYGEGHAGVAAFKSGWLPLALMLWQTQALRDAWGEWQKHAAGGTVGLKEGFIIGGAIAAAISSALSVYQAVHISLVENAFRAVQINSQGANGMLLTVKIAKLGLGLGVFISPFAFFGALGTSISNFNKWISAIRTGSAGERAGALIALTGDTGNSVVAGIWTARAGIEFTPVIAARLKGAGPKALGEAWALSNSRYAFYAARLTPWMLGFVALSYGGEAIYKYYNLDKSQRWLLNCCWGNEDQEWDWPTHAQRLAEATLQPLITDHGITQPENELSRFRTLSVSFPGMNVQALAEHPISFTAQWRRDNFSALKEVGGEVRNMCKLISNSPLTVQINLPYEWCGPQAVLIMRISVQPELAVAPLNNKNLFLHYRIPLDLVSVNAPIIGVAGVPHIGAVEGYELKLEHLNE
ncbi:toxin VasX [Pseudomonas helleri]|uniref:toxin VasX n=1 Tax=Pseudomonas helleri TaxID=1608996 RepID=UPI0030D7BA7F